MTTGEVHVAITADTTDAVNAMEQLMDHLALYFQRLNVLYVEFERLGVWHRIQHHYRETPEVSRMHLAYDRRWRSRRGRRR